MGRAVGSEDQPVYRINLYRQFVPAASDRSSSLAAVRPNRLATARAHKLAAAVAAGDFSDAYKALATHRSALGSGAPALTVVERAVLSRFLTDQQGEYLVGYARRFFIDVSLLERGAPLEDGVVVQQSQLEHAALEEFAHPRWARRSPTEQRMRASLLNAVRDVLIESAVAALHDLPAAWYVDRWAARPPFTLFFQEAYGEQYERMPLPPPDCLQGALGRVTTWKTDLPESNADNMELARRMIASKTILAALLNSTWSTAFDLMQRELAAEQPLVLSHYNAEDIQQQLRQTLERFVAEVREQR